MMFCCSFQSGRLTQASGNAGGSTFSQQRITILLSQKSEAAESRIPALLKASLRWQQ